MGIEVGDKVKEKEQQQKEKEQRYFGNLAARRNASADICIGAIGFFLSHQDDFKNS